MKAKRTWWAYRTHAGEIVVHRFKRESFFRAARRSREMEEISAPFQATSRKEAEAIADEKLKKPDIL